MHQYIDVVESVPKLIYSNIILLLQPKLKWSIIFPLDSYYIT